MSTRIAGVLVVLVSLALPSAALAHEAPTIRQARHVLMRKFDLTHPQHVTHCRRRAGSVVCELHLSWSGGNVEVAANYQEAVGWHGDELVAWEVR
jgi:hypothetical protein